MGGKVFVGLEEDMVEIRVSVVLEDELRFSFGECCKMLAGLDSWMRRS